MTIGTMIETPRAALRADEIAEVADFFSFGTNDLTQMTFGFSRDDVEGRMMDAYLELGLLPRNPFEVVDAGGVGELVRIGTERGRATRPGLKVGGLRRARRGPDLNRPLLPGRARLRQLLAVPGARGPLGRGAGGAGGLAPSPGGRLEEGDQEGQGGLISRPPPGGPPRGSAAAR